MTTFNEKEAAFLQRWYWELTGERGVVFNLATEKGFTYKDMMLVARAASRQGVLRNQR
jgi:hypothetical protein